MQCEPGHPDQYTAMQGRQKLPEPDGMHRRSNGKFGKCLEMNSLRWPVLAVFLFGLLHFQEPPAQPAAAGSTASTIFP